ncbi:MAG: hypothetical protein WDN25_31085 [Acetobacteraceae bacterium]
MRRHRFLPAWHAVCLLLGLAILASCAPTYDETTDRQIMAVQQTTDAGLVRLITLARRIDSLKDLSDPASQKALADARAKAGYAANADFYDTAEVDLTSLQLRMTATPDLSATKLDVLFTTIRDNLDDLRKFHSEHGLIGARALSLARTPINQQFKTLMQYELNLKSGKKAA